MLKFNESLKLRMILLLVKYLISRRNVYEQKGHFFYYSYLNFTFVIITPLAPRCGGFDPSVSPLVNSSVLFVCQHNCSETALQNFVKLCNYEGLIV